MKKIIYRTLITFTVIIFLIIFYLSIFGIKTDRFNSQIISHIKSIDKDIRVKINEVSVKLNLLTFSLDAKIIGTDLNLKNNLVKLESIKSKISLKSLLKNQFAISKIFISTKSLPVKDLISFIRFLNNDPKLFIAEQFVKKGYLVANLEAEFDEKGNVKDNYKIDGLINNGELSIFRKKISKLNFQFFITEKKFEFTNVKLLVNEKNLIIPKLTGKKDNNEFLVSGKLRNKNLKMNEKDLKEFIDNKFLNLNFKEIKLNSDSNFSFKVGKNLKFKDFFIKSNLSIDYLRLNNFLTLKNFFPNIKKDLIFENHEIELEYNEKNFKINGSGNIFFQKQVDNINYKIKNLENNIIIDANLKVLNNPFVIDVLNFKKNVKSHLDIIVNGNILKDEFLLEKIKISDEKNIFFIEGLKLTNNKKIKDVKKIIIDFEDKDGLKNKIQISKENEYYSVKGDSFNINEVVSQLLDSKNNRKYNFFEKKFKLIFDVKKIFLDKNNMTNNLKGSLLFNQNKINELNLDAEFDNKQKIKFTIKTTNNNEKITTLFSNRAKPLVGRYKFIKGFDEGELDFYSIKKNNNSNSTIKIYNFKLKELPALTKLLTLASLQGIADLLSGEGIRFNEFEMKFKNNENLITIDEIYAIGPAISILMEGYVEKNNLISLRGTLVPATTINKTISSIPLLGDILVGKKTGEGVFGVSFKIKGPPKNLETSVNPIKTLTPRFITRTLEKIKKN